MAAWQQVAAAATGGADLQGTRPVITDAAALADLVPALRSISGAGVDTADQIEPLATFLTAVASSTNRGARFLAAAGVAEQLVECWAAADPSAASTAKALSAALLSICTQSASSVTARRLLGLVARLESPAAQVQALQMLRQLHEKGSSSGWVGAAPSACLDLRGSDTAPGPGQEQAMRAGWVEAGDCASLSLPLPEEWPASGYSFVTWVRLEQRPASGPCTAALRLPIVTFSSGDTGWQLALTAGEPRRLVLRLTANAAAPTVVEQVLPPSLGDQTWYHVALVHTHPGTLVVYINGKSSDPIEVPYPKLGPVTKSYAGHSGNDGVWSADAAPPDAQLSNTHLIDAAMSPARVAKASAAGEREAWMGSHDGEQPLRSQCSFVASTVALAWQVAKAAGPSMRGSGNVCLLADSGMRSTLDRAGPLLLQVVALFGSVRGAAPLGALFSFIAVLMRAPVAKAVCLQANIVMKIACCLHHWTPITVDDASAESDCTALISGLEVFLSSFEEGSSLWEQAQTQLAWNMQIWAYSPASVQYKLFEMLTREVTAKPDLYREKISVALVLDMCRLCYYKSQPDYSAIPTELERGGTLCSRPKKDLHRLRVQLLSVVNAMMHDTPTLTEVEATVGLASHCKDDGLVLDALRLLLQLSGGSSRGTAAVEHLNNIGGLHLLLSCVIGSRSEHTDVLALRLMSRCLMGDNCHISGLEGIVSSLTTALASRPFTEDRLRAVMEFVAPAQSFRVPSGLRSILVLATEASDSIRQASLEHLEKVGGKELLCSMLTEIPGYDRLLVEFACTPRGNRMAGLRTQEETDSTVSAVAGLLSSTLASTFCTGRGRSMWQSTLFCFDEACREPGQPAELGKLLREMTHRKLLNELKTKVAQAAIDTSSEEPGHLWASVCFLLAKTQWKKTLDGFSDQTPVIRAEFAGLISALLADIVSKFQDEDCMQAMNKPIQSVEGKTLFDVVLMTIIQALLLKRDEDLVDIIQTLFQLELDDGDEGVLLMDGRLAFCVANMLKCLSTDARSGRTAADATISACDNRLVELLSDVLMLRWDSLSTIMIDANGVRLMDELGDEPPHAPVAEFAPIMFGAAWLPILGQMGKLSLESAKHFVLQNDNDYDNKKTEIALNAERESHCELSTAAKAKLDTIAVAANKDADAERLRWALPHVSAETAACTSILAELAETSSASAIWQVAGTELKDRSRVTLSRVWGGTNHMDAARVPMDQGSADGGSQEAGSYHELLETLRSLRATSVDASNPEHASLLEQLWTLLMPGQPGVPGKDSTRSAEEWVKIGFQSANPSTDFRAMGLLALTNLVSFASAHRDEAALIVSAAQSSPTTHYPLAITAINITGWIYSMMENHTLSEDHFASTESLGMTFTGFTVNRINELYSQTLLRFDRHWAAEAPDSVMMFTEISNDFLEQLWELAASGRLGDSAESGDLDQDDAAAVEETDNTEDDHEAYQEEIRKMAEATDTALKAAEEAKSADVMSIFDLDVGDALGGFSVDDAAVGTSDPNASFGEAVDVTVDEAKAQLDAAKAQMSAKFSSFGKKAAEKKEEARKAAAIARASAHKKAQVAEKRARVLSEGAHVLGDRISTTASHVAGEALTRADSIAKRNVIDLSQFHQSRCEVECIWENERRIMGSWRSSYLLSGSDFHSWTNQVGRTRIRLSGKPFVSKDDLQIDKSWCWLSDWHADAVDGHTDSNGFTYAATFSMPLDTWDAEPNACHFVRRRCWFRLRHPAVPDMFSPPKLPADRAQDIARVLLDANDLQLKRLRGWFDELDETGAGSLDRNAIESLLIKLGKTIGGQDLDKAVAEMDQDKSGRIDYIDFCDWWQSTASKRRVSEESPYSPRDNMEPEPEPEPEQVSASDADVIGDPEPADTGLALVEEDCELVTASTVATGNFAVKRSGEVVFATKDGKLDRSWAVDSIVEAHRRRYMMQWHGLELMLSDSTTVLLNFPGDKGANRRAFDAIIALRKQPLRRALFGAAAEAAELERLRCAWSAGALSNFEYLMQLNTLASRTYSDLSQYPVFPWVLCDYNSATLDLSSPAVYRDLSKPVGALNPSRLQKFLSRAEAIRDMPEMPFFLYGTHYSNLGAVTSFLLRLEPFTSIHVELQSGSFDSPDRLFHSIPLAWKGVNSNMADLKELPPEFYCSPEFLTNSNQLPLGQMQSGAKVDDVVLPAWATSPDDFIQTHRAALESEHVSAHLHEWIDLIFGFKQRGEAAEAAHNVFYHLTYEGAVDLDGLSDPIAVESIKSQIANFGQTPAQIFTVPHPARGFIGVPRPLAPPSLHLHADAPVKVANTSVVALATGSEGTLLAIDTEGQVFSRPVAGGAFAFDCLANSASTTSLDRSLGACPSLAAGFRKRALILCSGSTPTLCDATTGTIVGGLSCHAGAVTCYAIDPDGVGDCDLLAAGSVDGSVSLWRLPRAVGDEGALLDAWGGLAELPVFVGTQVTAVAVSLLLDLLVVGCSDGSVHTARVSDPVTAIKEWTVADGQPIQGLQISREHGYIVCATAAGVFLHTINAKLLASTGVPTSTLLLVPSSEEQGGELLVTGEGNDIVVRLASREWLREVWRSACPAGVASLAPARGGFAAGLADGSVVGVSLAGAASGL